MEILSPSEIVSVRKCYLILAQQHCECCPLFREQWQALDQAGNSFTPRPRDEVSKKRRVHQLPAPEPPRWKKVADSFLRSVPRPSEWRKRQVELGLEGVNEYKEVIQSFTKQRDFKLTVGAHQHHLHSGNELVDRVEIYALLTKSSLTTATSMRALSNFQAFILLSLCRVLETKGVLPEKIDQITQHITDLPEKERLRLRRSAVWVNMLIVELIKRGWTIYRATELFFISRPVNNFD